MKQLKAKLAQFESNDHPSIISGKRQSDSSETVRDSFGSFIDTSNPRVTRRLSTVGVPSLPSSRAASLTSRRASLLHTTKHSVSERSEPVKRSYTAHGSTRRLSLIERSRLASASSTVPSPPPSAPVTGVMRLGVRHAPQVTRRLSVVSSSASTRAKSDEPVVATLEAESESKKPKYTVSVNRAPSEIKPSYTYTPSTDRRALDSLMKNQRISMERDPEMSREG